MKSTLLAFYFLIMSVFVSGQGKAADHLFVGTFTTGNAEGVYHCEFDAATGELKLAERVTKVDNPTFLKVSPCRGYLYVASRAAEEQGAPAGYIEAYEIKRGGSLKLINKQDSHGKDPCHVDISADGKHVGIACYGSGTVSLYPILKKGKLGKATSTIQHEGRGPTSRQTEPHAHSIRFSPIDQSVYSADLGIDKLNIYRVESGLLVSGNQEYISMTPGAGPRHFEFHPSGKIIYVINELNSTVSILQKEGETWKKAGDISTLPADYNGKNQCADIHLSPNGKYLYASNRGHNSLAVYRLENDGLTLRPLGVFSVHGDWPRNFVIHPSGEYLLVANQKSNNITVFRISETQGVPVFTGEELQVPSPVCLEFL